MIYIKGVSAGYKVVDTLALAVINSDFAETGCSVLAAQTSCLNMFHGRIIRSVFTHFCSRTGEKNMLKIKQHELNVSITNSGDIHLTHSRILKHTNKKDKSYFIRMNKQAFQIKWVKSAICLWLEVRDGFLLPYSKEHVWVTRRSMTSLFVTRVN